MGWIKAQLGDAQHGELKRQAQLEGVPIHDLAGELLEKEMNESLDKQGRQE